MNAELARKKNYCTCSNCAARRRARLARRRYLQAARERASLPQRALKRSPGPVAEPNAQLRTKDETNAPCDCSECRNRSQFEQQSVLCAPDRYDDYRNLLSRLKQDGLVLRSTAGDGNCQFRALAHFAENPEIDHVRVRRSVVDFIEQNPDRFEMDIRFGGEQRHRTVADYCAEMRRLGVWGDGTTLMAFCLCYNVNVRLYTAHGWCDLYPANAADSSDGPPATSSHRPTICMARCGEHYDATDRILLKKPATADTSALAPPTSKVDIQSC